MNTDIFTCQTCNDGKDMTRAEAIEHIKAVHAVANMKATRQMTAHMDGRDYFGSVYEWTFDGDVKLTEAVTTERDKNDPYSQLWD